MKTLKELDGCRLAILMQVNEKRVMLRGIGNFYRDDKLGPSLRIPVDGQGTEVLLIESEWDGEVIAVDELAADYLIMLSASAPATLS